MSRPRASGHGAAVRRWEELTAALAALEPRRYESSGLTLRADLGSVTTAAVPLDFDVWYHVPAFCRGPGVVPLHFQPDRAGGGRSRPSRHAESRRSRTRYGRGIS